MFAEAADFPLSTYTKWGFKTKRAYHRWKKMLSVTGKLDDLRPCVERPTPANKLCPEEEQTILEQVNSPEFADSSPKQIVPQLADRGVDIASESTFYRTLHKHNMCHHRRSGKVHTSAKYQRMLPLILTRCGCGISPSSQGIAKARTPICSSSPTCSAALL